MALHGRQRNARAVHVPDVDAVVHERRARGHVVGAVGPPGHAADARDGLDRVLGLLDVGQVPDLDVPVARAGRQHIGLDPVPGTSPLWAVNLTSVLRMSQI